MFMIKLDGSYGEGGGQITRTALALSALTGKPFEVDNIRKGRCDCGLKTQHLFCVNAVKELCNARVEGALIGSTELGFRIMDDSEVVDTSQEREKIPGTVLVTGSEGLIGKIIISW